MIAVATLGNLLQLAGLVAAGAGFWLLAGGLRVVVSGRIDERRKSARALKRGLALALVAAVLFGVGTMVVREAGP